MNKKQKLVKSIILQFGCSANVASEWADNIEKAESELNGRIQPFQEFAESRADNVDDLSEEIRIRIRAKAGLRTFKESVNYDRMKLRIQHRGGIRI